MPCPFWGSLRILGAGGLLLSSDNDVGLVLGAAAGVFSVLGAVSGVFYLVIGIPGHPKLRPAGELRANFVLGVIVLVLVVIGLAVNGRVRPHRCGVQCVGLVLSIPLPSRALAESGRMESGPNHETVAWKTVCPALGDTVFFPRGEALIFVGKGWYNTLVCDAADSAGQYPAAKDVTG